MKLSSFYCTCTCQWYANLANNVNIRSMLHFMDTHKEDATEWLTRDYEDLYGTDLTKHKKTRLVLKRDKRKRIEAAHLLTSDNNLLFTFDARPHKRIHTLPIMIKPLGKEEKTVVVKPYDLQKHNWTDKYTIHQVLPDGLPLDIVACIVPHLHPSTILKMRLVCKDWKDVMDRDINFRPYVERILQEYRRIGLQPIKNWNALPLWKQYVLYSCKRVPPTFIRKLAEYSYSSLLLFAMRLYSGTPHGRATYNTTQSVTIEYAISPRTPPNKAAVYITTPNNSHFVWIPPVAARMYIPSQKNKEGRKEITVGEFLSNYRDFIEKITDAVYLTQKMK